jgi:4'-phosphopantetheinyl transferase
MTLTIYPVILPVPSHGRELPPQRRVSFLSLHAREALRRSAERLNIPLGPLAKNERGAPLPFDGHFWSLTHKPRYVGGVVAPEIVGLDLEAVRPCSAALFRKTAGDVEWALLGHEEPERAFFRVWTAKEAVLKTGGEGLKDLSRCRLAGVLDEARLLVDYGGRTWTVKQHIFDGHVASVAVSGLRVKWVVSAPADP